MRTQVVVGVLVALVAAGGGFAVGRYSERRAAAKAAPTAEILPCGHPRKVKTTADGQPLPFEGVADCTDPAAHRFEWVQGTWVPLRERPFAMPPQ